MNMMAHYRTKFSCKRFRRYPDKRLKFLLVPVTVTLNTAIRYFHLTPVSPTAQWKYVIARSRPHQNLVGYLDYVFWTSESFVTKLGMVIHTSSWASRVMVTIFNVKVTGLIKYKYDYFCIITLDVWSFCNHTWMIINYYKPGRHCCVHSQGHSKGSKLHWINVLSRWYLLNCLTFFSQT